MRILAISGSLRPTSSNSSLLRAMEALAPEGMEFQYYEGIADLPHFSPEQDKEEAAPYTAVAHLRHKLTEADAVIICTPEYAFGPPGSLKNALDWTVGSGDFYEKPTALISASPNYGGAQNAHASLSLTLQAMQAIVPEEASFTIPNVRTKLQGDRITDWDLEQQVKAALESLKKAVDDRPTAPE